jgi:DNA-binding cell septation regulator SpoVG
MNEAVSPAPARIEVLSITRRRGGNVKAFVSVRVGALTIHDVKVVQQAGQKPWVAMPSREWSDDDGKRRFSPLVELGPSLKACVEVAVLQAWAAEEGRHG